MSVDQPPRNSIEQRQYEQDVKMAAEGALAEQQRQALADAYAQSEEGILGARRAAQENLARTNPTEEIRQMHADPDYAEFKRLTEGAPRRAYAEVDERSGGVLTRMADKYYTIKTYLTPSGEGGSGRSSNDQSRYKDPVTGASTATGATLPSASNPPSPAAQQNPYNPLVQPGRYSNYQMLHPTATAMPETQARVMASANPYRAITDIALQSRADYTPPSQLGDTKTAAAERMVTGAFAGFNQVYGTNFGLSQEDTRIAALAIQMRQEQSQNNYKATQYYGNELQKGAQNSVARASEYHYIGKVAGVPIDANPYEYKGDLAVEFLKGSPTMDKDRFSPVSGSMAAVLPFGGYGLQQYQFDLAKGNEKNNLTASMYNVSYVPATAALINATGQYGPYGALYGGPDYKGTPSSEGLRMQTPTPFTTALYNKISAGLGGFTYTAPNKETPPDTLIIGGVEGARYGKSIVTPGLAPERLVGGGKVAAVGATITTPLSPAGVETAMAEGSIKKPFVSGEIIRPTGAVSIPFTDIKFTIPVVSGALAFFEGSQFVSGRPSEVRDVKFSSMRGAEATRMFIDPETQKPTRELTTAVGAPVITERVNPTTGKTETVTMQNYQTTVLPESQSVATYESKQIRSGYEQFLATEVRPRLPDVKSTEMAIAGSQLANPFNPTENIAAVTGRTIAFKGMDALGLDTKGARESGDMVTSIVSPTKGQYEFFYENPLASVGSFATMAVGGGGTRGAVAVLGRTSTGAKVIAKASPILVKYGGPVLGSLYGGMISYEETKGFKEVTPQTVARIKARGYQEGIPGAVGFGMGYNAPEIGSAMYSGAVRNVRAVRADVGQRVENVQMGVERLPVGKRVYAETVTPIESAPSQPLGRTQMINRGGGKGWGNYVGEVLPEAGVRNSGVRALKDPTVPLPDMTSPRKATPADIAQIKARYESAGQDTNFLDTYGTQTQAVGKKGSGGSYEGKTWNMGSRVEPAQVPTIETIGRTGATRTPTAAEIKLYTKKYGKGTGSPERLKMESVGGGKYRVLEGQGMIPEGTTLTTGEGKPVSMQALRYQTVIRPQFEGKIERTYGQPLKETDVYKQATPQEQRKMVTAERQSMEDAQRAYRPQSSGGGLQGTVTSPDTSRKMGGGGREFDFSISSGIGSGDQQLLQLGRMMSNRVMSKRELQMAALAEEEAYLSGSASARIPQGMTRPAPEQSLASRNTQTSISEQIPQSVGLTRESQAQRQAQAMAQRQVSATSPLSGLKSSEVSTSRQAFETKQIQAQTRSPISAQREASMPISRSDIASRSALDTTRSTSERTTTKPRTTEIVRQKETPIITQKVKPPVPPVPPIPGIGIPLGLPGGSSGGSAIGTRGRAYSERFQIGSGIGWINIAGRKAPQQRPAAKPAQRASVGKTPSMRPLPPPTQKKPRKLKF